MDLESDPKYKSYVSAIDKALKNFEYSSEWPDLISALTKLNKVITSWTQKFADLPKIHLVTKRLSQCLHPNLPSGVHLKALETYQLIFKSLPIEKIQLNLFSFTAGLLPLWSYCQMSLRPTLLTLYSTHLLPCIRPPCLEGFLISLLSTHESDPELEKRTQELLDKIYENNPTTFIPTLWEIIRFNSKIRLSAINYILQRNELIPSTMDLEALEECLADADNFVQRLTLDLILKAYPLKSVEASSQPHRLIKSSLLTLLRKDMSLNRRLFKWIGSEGSRTHVMESVIQLIQEDTLQQVEIVRIVLSLLDKMDILDGIILQVIRFFKLHQSNADVACMFFSNVKPNYVFEVLAQENDLVSYLIKLNMSEYNLCLPKVFVRLVQEDLLGNLKLLLEISKQIDVSQEIFTAFISSFEKIYQDESTLVDLRRPKLEEEFWNNGYQLSINLTLPILVKRGYPEGILDLFRNLITRELLGQTEEIDAWLGIIISSQDSIRLSIQIVNLLNERLAFEIVENTFFIDVSTKWLWEADEFEILQELVQIDSKKVERILLTFLNDRANYDKLKKLLDHVDFLPVELCVLKFLENLNSPDLLLKFQSQEYFTKNLNDQLLSILVSKLKAYNNNLVPKEIAKYNISKLNNLLLIRSDLFLTNCELLDVLITLIEPNEVLCDVLGLLTAIFSRALQINRVEEIATIIEGDEFQGRIVTVLEHSINDSEHLSHIFEAYLLNLLEVVIKLETNWSLPSGIQYRQDFITLLESRITTSDIWLDLITRTLPTRDLTIISVKRLCSSVEKFSDAQLDFLIIILESIFESKSSESKSNSQSSKSLYGIFSSFLVAAPKEPDEEEVDGNKSEILNVLSQLIKSSIGCDECKVKRLLSSIVSGYFDMFVFSLGDIVGANSSGLIQLLRVLELDAEKLCLTSLKYLNPTLVKIILDYSFKLEMGTLTSLARECHSRNIGLTETVKMIIRFSNTSTSSSSSSVSTTTNKQELKELQDITLKIIDKIIEEEIDCHLDLPVLVDLLWMNDFDKVLPNLGHTFTLHLFNKLRNPVEIESYRLSLLLLKNISGYVGLRKCWKKDIFELILLEPNFLQFPSEEFIPIWKIIVDNLFSLDKASFSELITRVSVPGNLSLFASKETEGRAVLLKRMAFVIWSCPNDQFIKHISSIQERLAEGLKSPCVVPVQRSVFLCFRVLILKFSNLSALWPIIIHELVQVLLTVSNSLPQPPKDLLALALETFKLLELLLSLPASSSIFPMYKWAFVGQPDAGEGEAPGFIPFLSKIKSAIDFTLAEEYTHVCDLNSIDSLNQLAGFWMVKNSNFNFLQAIDRDFIE